MRRRHEPEPVPATPAWQAEPDHARAVRPDLAVQLAEVDRLVERIASDRPEGGDLNTLATAVHVLIDCIRDLHGIT
jgi:hypothetical protein